MSKSKLCILNKTKQKDELQTFDLQAGKFKAMGTMSSELLTD